MVNEILTPRKPVTNHINGDCGAIDITQACLEYAFEATGTCYDIRSAD